LYFANNRCEFRSRIITYAPSSEAISPVALCTSMEARPVNLPFSICKFFCCSHAPKSIKQRKERKLTSDTACRNAWQRCELATFRACPSVGWYPSHLDRLAIAKTRWRHRPSYYREGKIYSKAPFWSASRWQCFHFISAHHHWSHLCNGGD
jgi:hypothetical protein